MNFDPTIFIVLAIVAVIAIGIFAWHLEKKRREAIIAWAHENGFSFSPHKRRDPGLGFSPFGQGHSRWSRYHLTKRVEKAVPGLDHAEADLFEYHYATTSGSGKNRRTSHHHFTCALLEAGLDLGDMTIRREHWGDKLVQAIGFDDIDFEDHEFSKKFMVKGRDRQKVYSVVDRRMMSYLLESGKWVVQTGGDMLFVHVSGKPNVERLDAIFHFAKGFLLNLPRMVVNEERERRGLPPVLDAGSAAEHHGRLDSDGLGGDA
ncbi:MAG: hypothetical protein ABFS86_13830 [Planctomycetota bacterium]